MIELLATAPRRRRARFTVYRDRAKAWRWRLTAANGEIVADSAESYTRRADATLAVGDTIRAVYLATQKVRPW